ncbi:anti-sigma regulatory factor (Ser/Thr protein kinase) [Nocardia kruczakiae]|uniref:Anti-sigma regulatory factor (Ser/Thr protein kinase) n=1 Tax=Nocardia kruczakiae TaxID=261477 RepID=A0ABU1XBJ8_9NOCA|nr:anti-sigma regulatory factor (Ser/Thr protein kinase) [Nocardia kruczakiae]
MTTRGRIEELDCPCAAFVSRSRSPDLDIDFPARADRLHVVRRALRDWLQSLSIGSVQASDVILAVIEACTNSVEHGHRGDGGRIRLLGERWQGCLHIVVADTGRWKSASDSETSDRGRGMQIIRRVAAQLTIDTHRDGTIVHFAVPIATSEAS